jgi:hypothetical protein
MHFLTLQTQLVQTMRWLSNKESEAGFVEAGYARAIEGIALEIRAEVEAKYTSQLEQCGFFQRWRLRSEIEQEIAALVAERSKSISPNALF